MNPSPSHAHRGLNRNLLILGILTLLILGGVAIYLATWSGGNVFNTRQNITNQIINNSYFTQLIASGATTKEDLKSIEEIRPYGEGFIGISKAQVNWLQAGDLAKRTGAEVLSIEDSPTGTKKQLIEWLKKTFAAQFQPTLWVRQDGQAKVTDGNDVLSGTSLESARKVALHWKANAVKDRAGPRSDQIRERAAELINRLGGTYEEETDAAGRKAIVKVTLVNKKVGDADLLKLQPLTELRVLDLNANPAIGDNGLAVVTSMNNLNTLILWGCHNVTDEGFAHLAGLTKLEMLNIGYTGVTTTTGSGLSNLRNLKMLRYLGLGSLRNLDGRHLVNIADLQNLESLALEFCYRVDDNDLQHLTKLVNLRALGLQATQVSDAGLKMLKGLTRLQTINLRETRVTDVGVADLQSAIPGIKVTR